MLTGEIRSQIDNIWNAFWSGGISNPLEVIEQITYLLFCGGSTTCTFSKRTRRRG
jgi:type I restriction enzyme M protein